MFVQIDARHDYCGVMEDLMLYWPKLNANGIMSGHDYLTSEEAKLLSGQDWSICHDGSIHQGAVKGAVSAFALYKNILITVTNDEWPTWVTRKPAC